MRCSRAGCWVGGVLHRSAPEERTRLRGGKLHACSARRARTGAELRSCVPVSRARRGQARSKDCRRQPAEGFYNDVGDI